MTRGGADDWSAGDLDYQQPRCALCGVVMRDIPGGWRCPSCHVGFMITFAADGASTLSRLGAKDLPLRRRA